MKQTLMSYVPAFAGALLAGQICYAAPASLGTIVVAAAAHNVSVPGSGLYGESGKPEISDLKADSLVYQPNSEPDGSPHYYALRDFDRVLFGFLQLQPVWIDSWFPTSEELKKLESDSLSGGDTYFLRYDPVDKKRRAVTVSPDWVDKTFGPAAKGLPERGPWWSWAVYQGAIDHEEVGAPNVTEIVMAISGEKLVPVASRDDHWRSLIECHCTPVWVVLQKSWYVVKSTQGTDSSDGSVVLSLLNKGGVLDTPLTFAELKGDIVEVYVLEDLPNFVEGQERKGEIAY